MRGIGPSIVGLVYVFGWALFWIIGSYLRNKAQQRRLEMIHQERMTAMEKGIPLPEVSELPEIGRRWRSGPRKDLPHSQLLGGIVCLCLGIGAMCAFNLSPDERLHRLWTMPIP